MSAAPAAVQDFFSLFELQPVYLPDREELEQRYRLLQRQLHPDRFVNASAQEQRLSVQWAGLINEGYRVLGDPVRCAQHLLQRLQVELPDEGTVDDPQLLLRHAEWREQLESLQAAGDRAGLTQLQERVKQDFGCQQSAFAAALKDGDGERARGYFYAMQFADRLCQVVAQAVSD